MQSFKSTNIPPFSLEHTHPKTTTTTAIIFYFIVIKKRTKKYSSPVIFRSLMKWTTPYNDPECWNRYFSQQLVLSPNCSFIHTLQLNIMFLNFIMISATIIFIILMSPRLLVFTVKSCYCSCPSPSYSLISSTTTQCIVSWDCWE